MVLKEGSGGLKRLLRKASGARKKHSKKDFLGSLFNKDSNAIHKRVDFKIENGKRKENNFYKFTAGSPLAKKSNLDRKFGGKAFTQKGKSEDRHKDNPEQKFKRQELVKSRLKSKKINEGRKAGWAKKTLEKRRKDYETMQVNRVLDATKFDHENPGELKVVKPKEHDALKFRHQLKNKAVSSRTQQIKIAAYKRNKKNPITEMKKSEWGKGGVGLSDPKSGKGRLFIGSLNNVFRDKYRHPKKGRMRMDANLTGKKPVKAQADFKKKDSEKRYIKGRLNK